MDPVDTGPLPATPEPSAARAEMARLNLEIESLQAVLVRMLQDVVDAEASLLTTPAAQLLQANEQLVISALASQAQAETAARALEQASQAPVLDALTRLPTRTTLFDRFGQALAHARRHGTRLGLLFVDLDDFKQLNDSHGHAFGDQVLQLTARALVAAVREGDTVSRHGGDEFVVLLAELSDAADLQALTAKLEAAVAAPMLVDGNTVRLGASVGQALYPDHGADLDTLIAHADAAMYMRKRARGGASTAAAAAMSTRSAAPATAAAQPPPDALRRMAELREANEKLVLAAITAQELQAAAELALQRHGSFANLLAEELRDPQAPVRIAAAMLGREPDAAPLLPKVQQAIEQRLQQMGELLGGLVASSRAKAGSLALDCVPLDIVAVVDAAVTDYRPLLQRKRQRLLWHPPAGSVTLRGDADRLRLVVSNLLDNASMHTSADGRIRVLATADASAFTLRVQDEGIGITPQMLPHVFEPFVMDTHALDYNGASRGIGLTVARALVLAHGGEISAYSRGAGLGSEFVVRLPLQDAPPASQEQRSAPALP